jgi:flagellar basal-body rod modification protein FlgD
MDVAATQTQTAAAGSQKSLKQLTSNFDTFLTLLTTQLKNQDPLEPMDSNQFTQQLVQFSQVEQQINSNANLEKLIALTKNQSANDAVSYLGKTVTLTDGEGALMDGSAKWAYSLENDATATKLMVLNANGKAVYVGNGETASGLHAFTWNGKDNGGNDLPPGAYVLKVIASNGADAPVNAHVASQGVVTEVDLTGDEPLLMLGPLGVPLSKAQLVSAQ